MAKNKIKLILASASPRRKELLGHLKLPFEIIIKNIPEETHYTDPVNFCRHISEMKGEAVFNEQTQDCLVVSADTIVSLDAKIYGKPRDAEEARVFLNELAGKTHSVFTAVTMNLKINGQNFTHSFVEESKVTFNPISPELMDRYIETRDSLDKAGAYGIQGGSLSFISKVDGDYANVVGFPLSRFVVECEKLLKPITNGNSWFDLFLVLSLFISLHASADFLGFKIGDDRKSKIPDLIEKLKDLKVEDSPAYEESFNQLVKSIENSMEEEKLFCSGETADANGKVLPKESKQLCFRELKTHYLEAMETIFDLKKKYLGLIHNRQIEKLSEIQKKLKADIEKSF